MNDSFFKIDDITWNDLDMDEVFTKIDTSSSSVGREYLMSSLKSLSFDEDFLRLRSKRSNCLNDNPGLLKDFDKVFAGLGFTKKISFLDYIFRLNELQADGNLKHYLMIVFLVAALAMLFIKPIIGIIGIIVMFAVNIGSYFALKGKIEAYFICVKYLAAMVIAARKIANMKLAGTPFEVLRDDLVRLSGTFASVKRGSWLITNSVSGSLTDVVMDYLRMLFHIDLIKFNNMRKTATDNAAAVRELYNALGEIQLSMCICRYRQSLSLHCVPSFDNNRKEVRFDDICHPLISNPVSNSIEYTKALLLTGSNASGKSTFLKSVAINQIFAQTIYTCLAARYNTCFCKVLTSMALTDNVMEGESYFVVEIKSLKRIMDELGDVTVMCFVDEVLRGTNTRERIAASSVILRALSSADCIVFAATHDIELTRLLAGDMKNYHFTEKISEGQVKFDYLLREGPSDSSNAIALLEMYGFESETVAKARELADK
ncbi:MAG: MutS-related protein [Lachnospiraceae bacterium]